MSEESPFDDVADSTIEAHIVDLDGRLRGYSITDDLARHYDLTSVLYMTATGRFPSERQRCVVDAALICACDVSIANAASHAARLARQLADPGGNPSSVGPVAALAAAEMTRYELSRVSELFGWLSNPKGELPEHCQSEEENDTARLLADIVPHEWGLTGFFARSPTSIASIVGALWGADVRRPEGITGMVTAARIPVLMAEAFAVGEGGLWSYPLNLPFWEYEAAT